VEPAIAASLTDYTGAFEAAFDATVPALLSIEGLWQIAQFIEQQRQRHLLAGGHTI
jgi:hypothetical protein